MTRSIFFIGATGYIGATVLDRILNVETSATVTVLVRNAALIPGFEKVSSQIKGLKGSLEDLDVLKEQSAAHDIVINCADADGLDATNAILAGMKARFDKTGVKGILIHTSGTGTLSDENAGTSPGDKVYTDGAGDASASPPLLPLSSLTENAFHRNVDLAIVAADEAGYVDAYIVLPSTIYGISSNRFAEAGLANPQSQQVPLLIRISACRGAAAMIGEGKNLWPDVHIHDCADLYPLIYTAAVAGKGEHGANGYYFAENGEHSLRDVAERIGAALKDKGILKTAEPRGLDKAELAKYTGGSTYLGTNSRARAVHSRAIGWKPKHDLAAFLGTIKDDVEWTLAHDRGKKDGEYVFGQGPVLVNGGWRPAPTK